MNKRIVITGAGGMLGRLCADWFTGLQGCDVFAFSRKEMDLSKDSSIRKALNSIGDFDVILNAAAMTDVDGCEDDSKLADQINGYAVGLMGSIAADQGAQVIHISSDYVFDGEKKEAYVERDEPNPISAYGESKHIGEEELFSSFPDHLAVRVSWLYGPGKAGFPEWVIRQAMAKEEVNVVSDKWGTTTSASEAVGYLESFVLSEEPYGGVLHMANTGTCSWNEWGQHCLDCAAEAGIPLKTKQLGEIKMDDLAKLANWKAKRPRRTSLATDQLTKDAGITPAPWQEAVAKFIEADLAPKILAE
ncbi:MAG: dTDP-4-dehydrorhamnose reductase [Verrucomicrobiota bacterium]